ncbi:MAG: PLP-dependent aminotransferase family protein [Rhodobacteraceae bacterium]|nr:PLP-dependent aminotransferase family protein [Paracoccaceae bacterium]
MPDTSWRPDLTQFRGPKYIALSHALRDAVRSGALPEGTRLPPVRDLAWHLGVTPGTVARAYQIGTQDGLLEAAVGRGTFVASRTPQLGPTEPMHTGTTRATGQRAAGALDLRSPDLPEVGQGAAIAAALRAMADAVGPDYLDYPGVRSDQGLRAALARWLDDRPLGAIGAEDIVLTNGGQNAIGIIFQCCLRGERPVVFAEELAYPGFRHAARLNRAEVIPVALDGQGMRADALDLACRRHAGRIVCLTPEAQNPTTARMTPERRAEIVAVARMHDLQILEDDCYAPAHDGTPALRAAAPERTWHVTSLSKSIAAGLRFGVVVAPTGRGEAARLAAQHNFFGLARPVTDLVQRLLETGEADRLRAAVRAAMARRLEIALNALGRHDVGWQKGLSYLWVRMPSGWRASSFGREAEAAGVLVRQADEYALSEGRAPNAVRVALAGGATEARFAEAMQALARLLDNPPRELSV